jgi:hypothetical protein
LPNHRNLKKAYFSEFCATTLKVIHCIIFHGAIFPSIVLTLLIFTEKNEGQEGEIGLFWGWQPMGGGWAQGDGE